jgi:hypothetical protein
MIVELSDIEISEKLALAIGWKEWQLEVTKFNVRCLVGNWRTQTFDYMDWNVISPIAAKYDCFPVIAACHGDMWVTQIGNKHYYAHTPQGAIAMAVIDCN